jgi:hypothetical protein
MKGAGPDIRQFSVFCPLSQTDSLTIGTGGILNRWTSYRRKKMTNMKYTTAILAALFCCMAAASAGYAQDNSLPAVQPDNTQVNMRDRNAGEVTADQQGENDADREMTKQIRQSIMGDKSLSSYAHNIKVISQDGGVTLKGPVRSRHEKQTVIEKAIAIAGDAAKVTDQISIKR